MGFFAVGFWAMCKTLPVLLVMGNSLRWCCVAGKYSLNYKVSLKGQLEGNVGTRPVPESREKLAASSGSSGPEARFYLISAADCRSICFHSPLMIPARICVADLPFWFCWYE